MLCRIPYTLIRSDRKTIAIELTRQGEVVVRCPRRMTKLSVNRFVASREDWITAHLEKIAAIPTPDVSGQISTHNTDTTAHSDIRAAMPTIILKNW